MDAEVAAANEVDTFLKWRRMLVLNHWDIVTWK